MRMRRWAMGSLGAAGAVLVAGATAWACVSGPAINLSTVNAKPGQEVTFNGTNFSRPEAATVRWNALDGPVLTTVERGAGNTITGTFTVPATATAGNYVVVFSQSGADGKLTQLPVRALLTVTPEGGATPVLGGGLAPVDTARPAGLVTADNDISGATLALIGLGVAGVGMFVAGMASLFAGRRGSAPAAAKVRS